MKVRLTQLIVGILFMISLLVSLMSACSCSHHLAAEKPSEKPACHSHSIQTEPENQQSDVGLGSHILPGECCCMQPAPKALVKSEKINTEKAQMASVPLTTERKFPGITTPARPLIFEQPAFLTESLCRFTSGRAPPPVKPELFTQCHISGLFG
jgi:hypothetical protein